MQGTAPTAEPTPGSGKRIGVLYRVELRQAEALRDEAFRRAKQRGSGKPDASEVLREILDSWIRLHRSGRG